MYLQQPSKLSSTALKANLAFISKIYSISVYYESCGIRKQKQKQKQQQSVYTEYMNK